MRVRILGAHQCQTANRHFTSILIDDWLAIDAGSLATTLTLEEQLKVTDVLLTHEHWDHVKDLGGFGYNLLGARQEGSSVAGARIHCAPEVRATVIEHLLAEHFWMNFFTMPTLSDPVFAYQEVGPGATFSVGPYRVQTVAVPHAVPVQGYALTTDSGRTIYYTGDNGEGCGQEWARVKPNVLITECTYSDEYVRREGGKLYGHLSPSLLAKELEAYRARRGELPRVLVVHVNPFSEDRMRVELAAVARALDADLEIAREGLTFEL